MSSAVLTVAAKRVGVAVLSSLWEVLLLPAMLKKREKWRKEIHEHDKRLALKKFQKIYEKLDEKEKKLILKDIGQELNGKAK